MKRNNTSNKQVSTHLSTGVAFELYCNVMFLNSTLPSLGHSPFRPQRRSTLCAIYKSKPQVLS